LTEVRLGITFTNWAFIALFSWPLGWVSTVEKRLWLS